jgi:hypothetical protein
MRSRFLLVGGAACCVASAQAQTIVSDNFDAYTAGTALNAHAPWDPTSSPNFTISTDHALSGPNSAKVVGTGVTGSTDFAWINLNSGNNYPYDSTHPLLSGSVSMWLNSGLQSTDWAGLTVFDTAVNRVAGIRYNGAGTVQFWAPAGWVTTQIVAPTDEWVNLRIRASYTSATSATIQYYINDLRFDAYGLSYGSGFGVADFDLYQFGNATAYFDNYVVAKAVPEPATLAVLGIGLLALRRRRSA